MQIILFMSSMFRSCSSLLSFPDYSNLNTNNINDMSCMFRSCSKLTSLPDNVNNMDNMFSECLKIVSLPDISK